MRASLKAFGATLSQVSQQVEADRGEVAVSRTARVLFASLALATAASAHAQPDQYSEQAGAPVAAASASEPAISIEAQQKLQDIKSGAARVGGALVGGIMGSKLASGAGSLWKSVATLGGAAIGQAAGGAIVPGTTPQERLAGKNQDRYDQALVTSFNPQTKTGAHVLPAATHANLADMMVTMAASRLVAAKAMRVMDEKELAAATSPRDTNAAAGFTTATRTYQSAFGSYAKSHHEVWNVIKLAQQKGYDVSAQRVVMETVPADLRSSPSHPTTDWPGVKNRSDEMGDRFGLLVNYRELGELGNQSARTETAALRERQR